MTEQPKPLTEAETAELLDWVSACQSSYHIDSTPGHRFGGLGSHLQENRDALVEYVNALIEARAQPAQAVPVLTEREIEDMYEAVKGKGWSLDFARAVEQAVLAKMGMAVPEQISEGEFAPDAKLVELADKIDHEQNWRHSGIFQRDHLTQDQKDRVLAGVMLRRYADLMAPESWRLFPPKSVVSHSYRAATLEAVVKMAERHGIVGKEGA